MNYVIIVLESHCNPVLKGCSRNMLLMYNAPSSLIAQKLVEIMRYNNKEYIVNQRTKLDQQFLSCHSLQCLVVLRSIYCQHGVSNVNNVSFDTMIWEIYEEDVPQVKL